jgi:hypothetical protein
MQRFAISMVFLINLIVAQGCAAERWQQRKIVENTPYGPQARTQWVREERPTPVEDYLAGIALMPFYLVYGVTTGNWVPI